jgi:hypothetical protein
VEQFTPAPEAPYAIRYHPVPAPEPEIPMQRFAAPPALTLIMHQEIESPSGPASEEAEWTENHERALDRYVATTRAREATSSLENVQNVLEKELAAIAVALRAQPQAISSELGQAPPAGREFWFTVNAELVIYGATDPAASVTIGERRIQLRPDGSFSYRFALPDGSYQLPITAASADDDRRHVTLAFSRDTVSRGEVGKHPQDPALRPPAVENLA